MTYEEKRALVGMFNAVVALIQTRKEADWAWAQTQTILGTFKKHTQTFLDETPEDLTDLPFEKE